VKTGLEVIVFVGNARFMLLTKTSDYAKCNVSITKFNVDW
jgi:hypothetical protein